MVVLFAGVVAAAAGNVKINPVSWSDYISFRAPGFCKKEGRTGEKGGDLKLSAPLLQLASRGNSFVTVMNYRQEPA